MLTLGLCFHDFTRNSATVQLHTNYKRYLNISQRHLYGDLHEKMRFGENALVGVPFLIPFP